MHVPVLIDSVAVKAHINWQGRTRSKSLILEAKRVGFWAEHHLCSFKAEHISGVANVQADWLSRQEIDHASGICIH